MQDFNCFYCLYIPHLSNGRVYLGFRIDSCVIAMLVFFYQWVNIVTVIIIIIINIYHLTSSI